LSSSPFQQPATLSTAIADVGNFSEMRCTAAVSVPSAPARPIATLEVVGSCPTTSRVLTLSATPLISSIIVPGVAP
jgi:hypothetical protein